MIEALILAYLLVMAGSSQHPDYEVGFYSSVGECAANQLYYDDMVYMCLDPSVRWEYREPELERCLMNANDRDWEECL